MARIETTGEGTGVGGFVVLGLIGTVRGDRGKERFANATSTGASSPPPRQRQSVTMGYSDDGCPCSWVTGDQQPNILHRLQNGNFESWVARAVSPRFGVRLVEELQRVFRKKK